MKKIVVFSPELNPTTSPQGWICIQLLNILKAQAFEVYVIGSKNSLPPEGNWPDKIQFLFPIKNWRAWETFKIVPLLLNLQPDILHFIEPATYGRIPSLHFHNVAPQMLSTLLSCSSLSSFAEFNFEHRENFKKYHQHSYDQFIFSCEGQRLKALPYLGENQDRGHVLPLYAPLQTDNSLVQWTEKPFVYLPARPEELIDPNQTLAELSAYLLNHPEQFLIAGAGWASLPPYQRKKLAIIFHKQGTAGQVIYPPAFDLKDIRHCAQHCHKLWTSGIDSTSFTLAFALSTYEMAKNTSLQPESKHLLEDKTGNDLSRIYSLLL